LTEGCLEKYGKRLIGRNDVEDALQRLDKLTQEEVRMAVAENLKATHIVDERVRGVANTVSAIDDRVAEIIHGAQLIFCQARGIFNLNHSDGKEADQVIKQTANDVNQAKCLSSHFIGTDYGALHIIIEDRLRENIHKWLSPPDPSTNHNIACSTHHKKIATWFFQGSIFREWKTTPSLLWIHGKRKPSLTSYPISSDDILHSSWLRQEHPLVGAC
jgi:hypothetical protein